jgi:hypothetical protein
MSKNYALYKENTPYLTACDIRWYFFSELNKQEISSRILSTDLEFLGSLFYVLPVKRKNSNTLKWSFGTPKTEANISRVNVQIFLHSIQNS